MEKSNPRGVTKLVWGLRREGGGEEGYYLPKPQTSLRFWGGVTTPQTQTQTLPPSPPLCLICLFFKKTNDSPWDFGELTFSTFLGFRKTF